MATTTFLIWVDAHRSGALSSSGLPSRSTEKEVDSPGRLHVMRKSDATSSDERSATVPSSPITLAWHSTA